MKGSGESIAIIYAFFQAMTILYLISWWFSVHIYEMNVTIFGHTVTFVNALETFLYGKLNSSGLYMYM